MTLTLKLLNKTASSFAKKLIAVDKKDVLKGAEPLVTALSIAIRRKAEAQGILPTNPNAGLTEVELANEYEAQLSAAEGRMATEGTVLLYYEITREMARQVLKAMLPTEE